MKRIILIVSILILTSCNFLGDPLIGTWQINPPNGDSEFITFTESGFMMTFTGGKTMMLDYEAITEVEPHQLYVILEDGEKSERLPLGIYKIEGKKMIFKESIEYHKAIGLIDMGTSRYEMPKDFSGTIKIYEKIN